MYNQALRIYGKGVLFKDRYWYWSLSMFKGGNVIPNFNVGGGG